MARLPNIINRHAVLLACALTLLALAKLANLDDHVWYQWQELTTTEELRKRALWLPDYRTSGPAQIIPGAISNASGITYDADSDSLWILANRPGELLELDRQLQLKRRIALPNFKDSEAVVYLGAGRFIISDERSHTLVMADISPSTQSLDKDTLPQLSIKLGPLGNKGLEGMAYDRSGDTLYAARERDPRALAQIDGLLHSPDNIVIDTTSAIDVDDLYLNDLSGLHFDEKSGHLLMLSDESMLLAEVDQEGNRISYMDLQSGFNGQLTEISQAEGITVDDQQVLYIVSEPNLIYRFERDL